MENLVVKAPRAYPRLVSVFLATMILMALFSLSYSQRASAQPGAVTWPTISLSKVVSGLEKPLHLTHAGDGSGRIFVVEQAGRIRILKNGHLSALFLDITDRVRSPVSGGGSEEGLLSVAFPPGFGSTKDYFYVYYTRQDGDNRVSRFHLSPDPDLADPASEQLILSIDHPTYSNHNGGQLAFGPDGFLYIGTGDGGGGGDTRGNAQNTNVLLGKLLRIDVEPDHDTPASAPFNSFLPLAVGNGDGLSPSPYQIPADNPFVGQPGYRSEIWAYGLRNPWRFSFDRQAGDLFIADVGQSQREEVNFQPAASNGGQNYGWNVLEGTLCFNPPTGCSFPQAYVPPVAEYDHGLNNSVGCSISGGFVYRGSLYPTMQGIYFYGDYCTGKVWGLQKLGETWQDTLLLDTGLKYAISSFGEDQAAELYLMDHSRGDIYKIIAAQP